MTTNLVEMKVQYNSRSVDFTNWGKLGFNRCVALMHIGQSFILKISRLDNFIAATVSDKLNSTLPHLSLFSSRF